MRAWGIAARRTKGADSGAERAHGIEHRSRAYLARRFGRDNGDGIEISKGTKAGLVHNGRDVICILAGIDHRIYPCAMSNARAPRGDHRARHPNISQTTKARVRNRMHRHDGDDGCTHRCGLSAAIIHRPRQTVVTIAHFGAAIQLVGAVTGRF